MSRFQVGLSAGLFGADGSPCFDPDILEQLYRHEGIDTTIMEADKTRITAEDAARFDAIYLMLEKVDASILAPQDGAYEGRLRLTARHGVGFDSVDVAGQHITINNIARRLMGGKGQNTAQTIAGNIVKTFIRPAQGMRGCNDIIHK